MNSSELKLLSRQELIGTQYIELAVDNGKQWRSDSVYVRDALFAGLFNPEFEKANSEFSFFGSAEFDVVQLEELIRYLQTNKLRLEMIETYPEFIRFFDRPGVVYKMEPVLLGEFPQLKDTWPEILQKFTTVTSETINFVDTARMDGKNLWVYGL